MLLIHGEGDARDEEGTFLRACRHGQLEVLPGATHAAPLERPDVWNAALLRWLARIDFI